jgi:hypothetical protein
MSMMVKQFLTRTSPGSSGWHKTAIASFLLILGLTPLAGCSPAAAPVPTQVPVEETQIEAATSIPLPTDTPQPTSTATPLPTATPQPTATAVPTNTPVPPLAVLPDGFNAWCAPLGYEGVQPTGPDAPDYARQLTLAGDQYQVPIPAVFCDLVYQFNQAVPAGLKMQILEGSFAFVEAPLIPDPAKPEVAWAAVTHDYVVNPPMWEVVYRVAVVDSNGTELWSNPVKFVKPLPEPCPYGGLPDPVTLWCTVTDPWEIEPWPDVTYPYDRSRLTPDP